MNLEEKSGGSTAVGTTAIEFELAGENFSFAPFYYPRKVTPSKERRLSEQSAICEGEDVTDIGSKNREIVVRGYLRMSELPAYDRFIESGATYDLISLQWSGEVVLRDTELDGPMGVDTDTGDWLFIYDFTLKSTGKDERHTPGDGIIDRGVAPDRNLATDGTGGIATSEPEI